MKPAEKARKVSDEKGLYVEVMPTGSKLWRLTYRIHGKEKRISLGTFPETGLKLARESRDEARALIAKGIDPSAHRKATKRTAKERAANDFEAIAREWFAMTGAVWADTHRDRVLHRLERDVFPALGPRPIAEITPPEVLQMLRRIEKRTVETAHRAMRSCGQIFRYGIATGRCTTDSTRDLRGALSTDKGGQHFAATTEPKRLGQILSMLDAYPGTPVVRAALQFAPLVFVRPGELRKAEWSQFDMDVATGQFTSSKTKQPHFVPLERRQSQSCVSCTSTPQAGGSSSPVPVAAAGQCSAGCYAIHGDRVGGDDHARIPCRRANDLGRDARLPS